MAGRVQNELGANLIFSNVTAGPIRHSINGSTTLYFGQESGTNNLYAFELGSVGAAGLILTLLRCVSSKMQRSTQRLQVAVPITSKDFILVL